MKLFDFSCNDHKHPMLYSRPTKARSFLFANRFRSVTVKLAADTANNDSKRLNDTNNHRFLLPPTTVTLLSRMDYRLQRGKKAFDGNEGLDLLIAQSNNAFHYTNREQS